MNILNLKLGLLNKLISIHDMDLLQKLNDLVKDVDVEQSVFKVSNAQKAMLMRRLEDIKHNRLISDEELNAEEQLWLNR